ncbi:MAG: acetylxylan esterase [Candidatus Hydrogenedentes bacterium]|nr:acetylxylan esterase [Candidatus Hydrogenedentota bacterium]
MLTGAAFMWGVMMMAASDGEELAVFSPAEGGQTPGEMMVDYLQGQAAAAYARRAEAFEALSTPEELHAWQEARRAFFVEQLGGWPERTPLNARIVGAIDADGFRVERVVYESRPGFPVTAALFLPLSDPPWPGVLVPCGHSATGKACDLYQQVCIFLARNGLAALIYDPIGQGERSQILTDDGKPRFGSTMEHTLVGVGSSLLGTNTAAFRIWDGMRGIDYLCSREDIDATRIGCTGNSGGGTLTSYIMALDERVACAAPSCYLTSFERLNEKAGPQDAEQNIAGQIGFGMDHADYILMRAPKPTVILCATHDFFDISGTWDTFRQAKRFYTKLGFPERVDLVEAPEKHGFSDALRQGAVRWMRRWLLEIDDAVVEAESTVFTPEQLYCTPEGQVMRVDGVRSTFDINAEQADGLIAKRKAFWAEAPKAEALARVRAVATIRPLADLPAPEHESGPAIERDGYRIEKHILRPEPGIALPALLFVPATANGQTCLYIHGEGKAADAAPGGAIEARVREGYTVLAPDLRGLGETQADWGASSWLELFGPDWKAVYLAYLLGKPYLAMRAEDVAVCARFLAQHAGNGAPVHLVAVGEAGPPALHAAALEPGLFASVRIERSVVSWDAVVRTPIAKRQLVNTVHGALQCYDLPDLAASLPEGLLTIAEPLDPTGQPAG